MLIVERIFSAVASAAPAFRSRNFRLYFGGQLVSFTGTWLQNLAQGWLIFELTHSAVWTGAITSAMTLPGALFATFGGVTVDRFGARRVMYVTNLLFMIPALALGIMTLAHVITPFEVAVLAFLTGLVNAFDSPSRQALMNEVVEKDEQLKSAIIINTAMIQSAQFVGPAIAGFLIIATGIGWTFIINAVSCIAVLVSLVPMQLEEHSKPRGQGMVQMMTDGVRYAATHKEISVLILLITVIGGLGYSFRAMLPVLAGTILHDGPKALTYLTIATGSGAIIGTITMNFLKKVSSRAFIVIGSFLLGISLTILPVFHLFAAVFSLLFLAGAGFTMATTTIRVATQMIVEKTMKGRVVGVLIMCFFGGISLASFLTGIAARHFGALAALQANGVVILMIGIATIIFRKKIAAVR